MGYRGEVMAKFRSTTDVVPAIYKPGERFAQLVLIKLPEFDIEEVAELSNTERGENGYGSSDIENTSAAMATEPANETVQPTNEQAAGSVNELEQA